MKKCNSLYVIYGILILNLIVLVFVCITINQNIIKPSKENRKVDYKELDKALFGEYEE